MKQLDLLTIYVQCAIVTCPGRKLGMKKQIMFFKQQFIN